MIVENAELFLKDELSLNELFSKFIEKFKGENEIEELKKFMSDKIKMKTEIEPKEETSSIKDQIKTRHYAKNFAFHYEKDVSLDLIVKNLKEKFPSGTLTKKESHNENIFFVKLDKKSNITSNARYSILGRKPLIRALTKAENIENFYFWENSDKVLLDFLSDQNPLTAHSLSTLIKNSLSTIDVVVNSEYLLSSLFLGWVYKFGIVTKWEKIKIFSVDSKMEEIANNTLKNFRCDLLLSYEDVFFVIEFKYRYDRKNDQSKNALECIRGKDYVRRIKDYLKKNYLSLYSKIKKISSIGIGYSIKNQVIYAGTKYEITELCVKKEE
jgi:hypothetical protein